MFPSGDPVSTELYIYNPAANSGWKLLKSGVRVATSDFFRNSRRAPIDAAEITFGLSYGDFGLWILDITRTIFLAATALREMIYNVDTGVRVKLPTRHYILFYAARVAGANPILRLISVRGSKMFKSEKT